MSTFTEARAQQDLAERKSKIGNSLRLIEEAQNNLYHAAREICSVPGLGKEWSKVGKMGDQVKELWHHLEERK